MIQLKQTENKMKRNLDKFKDKNVLVVGLARSGTGAANLLSSIGAKVSVTDIKSRESLNNELKSLLPEVKVVAGEHPDEMFKTADLIVVSPGVPLSIQSLKHAKTNGVPVISELELGYQIVMGYGLSRKASEKLRVGTGSQPACPAGRLATPAFIGITGTNGKSTTTTLINKMLKKANFRTILAGNIGSALSEEINKALDIRGSGMNDSPDYHSRLKAIDYFVTEISSFQLESIRDFRPYIAVILNITPDHLDRYGSMKEYINAKAGVFRNQRSGDCLILNADDPVVMELYNSEFRIPKSRFKDITILFFSRKKEVEGIYMKNGSIHCNSLSTSRTVPRSCFRKKARGTVSSPLEIIAADEIKIKGVHNLENAMAASLGAIACGCPVEVVRDVLREFPGLKHRLEFISEINGVSFINDSKGTNISAVSGSLESFKKVILIMGGRDKAGDFSVLRNVIKEKVKTLLVIGEAKEKIAETFAGTTEIVPADSLKEAVDLSAAKASSGDVVLLSPGCTSFDMFTDFEDRGREFEKAVKELETQNHHFLKGS